MSDFPHQDEQDNLDRRAAFMPGAPEGNPLTLDNPSELVPTEPLDVRRTAAFRPPEEIAWRLDIARSFKRSMEADAAIDVADASTLAEQLYASAATDEALGNWDGAALTVNQLRRRAGMDEASWRLARRVWRHLGEWDLVEESLQKSSGLAQGTHAALDDLEHATLTWMRGAPAENIALLCASVALDDEQDSVFAIYWRAQLVADALLSTGDLDGAMEVYERLLDERGDELPRSVGTGLELLRVAWLNLNGHIAEAAARLVELGQHGRLPVEWLDALAFMLAELGQLDSLTRFGDHVFEPSTALVALAARLHIDADALERAERVLAAGIAQNHSDSTLLLMGEHVLEERYARQGDEADKAQIEERLIQVLNQRLEVAPTDDECVALLLRLGRLYEDMTGADDAAAEVYREALQLAPSNAAVLRALGRVYNRNESWDQLAKLYEHEVSVLARTPGVWRRHFQAARHYEARLGDQSAALEHYLAVLEVKTHFLPALKAAARIMDATAQWAELADLFLSRVATSGSTRQKLYMLDKVAEIAEKHLDADDIAIGAWQEILIMNPEHPNAYAALGRLLARNKRWAELIELNRSEMDRIDDPEELADMCLRNAEILVQHLDDPRRAEQSYRSALAMLPDYLPALEGLGRLLATNQRWDDLMSMTSNELACIDDRHEQIRQLGALAETAELHLGRSLDAIALHEEAFEMAPDDINSYFALRRLYRVHHEWEKLAALLERRLEYTSEPGPLASLHGELATLYEWQLSRPVRAFGYYRAALCVEPSHVHWLTGISRLWASTGQAPMELAGWLEELCRNAELDGEIFESYRAVICRLRERACGMPEAALELHRAGHAENLEHAVFLRLGDGVLGERQAVARHRLHAPMHPWEVATIMPRHNTRQLDSARPVEIWGSLDRASKPWFAGEVDAFAASQLSAGRDEQRFVLAHELAALVHGGERACDGLAGPETSAARLRLRALDARRHDELDEYEAWTRRECSKLERSDLVVMRLLELAHSGESVRRDDLIKQAAEIAFPELVDELADEQVARGLEGVVVEELYDALCKSQSWELLRDCLVAHVERPGLGKIRKAYLLDMLSDTLERCLGDLDGALNARRACWDLTDEADNLISLVRLSEALGIDDDATMYQSIFFEALWDRDDIAPSRCIEAGMKLSRMFFAHGEEQDMLNAIALLENIILRYDDFPQAVDVRLELARAHASHGDAYKAVELFRRTLTPEGVGRRQDDWRELIRLWRDELGDSSNAYNLQWTLVRHDPCSEQDLITLVDLAEESGALDNCAEELVRLSEGEQGARARALDWQAAVIFDEYLGWFERACDLYQQLIEGCEDDEERVRLFRRRAFCLCNINGGQPEALATFRELIEADPFDVATYRGMSALFNSFNNFDRARVVAQVQRTLGDMIDIEKTRLKTVPSRPLEDADVVRTLLPANLSPEVLEAIRASMPLVNKLWDEELPQRKALENNRKASKDLLPVADLFYTVFDAFGLRRLRVWFGDSHPEPVQVISDGSPLVWLNTEVLADFDEPELRFLAGYCAAYCWAETTGLLHIGGRRFWHLLEGVFFRQTNKGFTERVDVASQELAELVASPLYAVSRRRVLQALEPAIEELGDAHCEAWPRAMEQFAHRLGLVLCGDIEASARCILKLGGWRGELHDRTAQRMIRRHEHIRELLTFALSEDYLHVRYQLGLSGRPSVVAAQIR